jgi:hypothetical protein
MLALGLGLTVGLIVLYWGFNQYQSIFTAREGRLRSLKNDVAKKDIQVALIYKAIAQRRELQERSLPANEYAARSEYGNWLLNLVIGKLTDPSVSPHQGARRSAEGYTPLGFEVKGQGSMGQIIRVLHDFYSASHLHQITSLDLQPQPKGSDFNLTMRVEAVILPETERKDRLTEEPNRVLAFGSASDYEKQITERNFFAEYTPPRPTGTPLDLANLTYLTNIGHGIDRRPTAWIYERSNNKTTYLFEGDSFQIAGLSGKVKRIDIEADAVELEIDGKSVVLGQQKSLGETVAALKK